MRRTRAQGFGLCALVASGLAVLMGVSACQRRGAGVVGNPRVVVLGFDGLDPERLDALRADGKLPNIDALIEDGDYRPLETTLPVAAPVAWTSFSTGLTPAEHGVFGRMRRDPATYEVLDAVQSLGGPEMVLGFPLYGPTATSGAKGATFWERADEAGVRTVVLRVPYAFPPRSLEHGRSLCGVGVFDVAPGGGFVELRSTSGADSGEISGIEVDGWSAPPVPISFARNGPKVRISIGEREIFLEEGKWSELQGIVFDVSPFHSVAATIRVYVRSIEPEVRIYVSSPAVDPRHPERPISAPPEFASQLAMQVGLFEPLGAARSASAYEAEVVDEAGFVGHAGLALDWARRATLHEIDQRDAELVVSVFTETGDVLRLFGNDEADGLVEHAYRAVDRIIGDVRRHLPADTILFVVSTHGSDRFSRAVSLNAWLEREGFQTRTGTGGGLENVDWGRTRAYAIGSGQVYLNLAGRERDGIVAPGLEAQVLLEEISAGLRTLRYGATASPVVEEILRRGPEPLGPFDGNAAELVVSFAAGFGGAPDDAEGGAAGEVIASSALGGRGGHRGLGAAPERGLLLSSVPLAAGPVSVLDLAPTVLGELGVPVAAELPGRSLGPGQTKSGATGSWMR
ncbi:MAG: alkaline phosphatase family protein [Candidatus Binatia bacterium]|nr:alkaline phosphatase family protein [Candidatus Binatia bacterium]